LQDTPRHARAGLPHLRRQPRRRVGADGAPEAPPPARRGRRERRGRAGVLMAWNPLDDLTPRQREQLALFAEELARVNRRVNLVSPATVPEAEERHLVHSLALARRAFPGGATVVDWGSGGGLPAVPLAIRFPETDRK